MIDDALFQQHVQRLRSSLSAHSQDSIIEFLTTHTYLRGEKFNFKGREYQRKILEDRSQEIVCIKSAQIGISELSSRLALARAVLSPAFTTIYTLPSALAAGSFMKTRIDPVINSSPYLSGMVDRDLDNSLVKRFGESHIYLKGAQVDTQAISVPADLLVTDELDNSNQDVVTLYNSRLIASPFKLKVTLSTPTIPNYGIDMAYKQSRRHLNMCKCWHCNEWCYPDYHTMTRIPGYGGRLEDITRQHFANPNFRWMEAYLACPKCAKALDLNPENREWVVENPGDSFIAAGYRVSPFDCPSVISVGDLVKSSVDYTRPQDFSNQRLGLPLEDKESSLLEDELRACLISEYPGGGFSYVMGVDMGNTCHIVIAAVLPDNRLIVVHRERVSVFEVIHRRKELARQYRVRMTVVDHGPMTESVYRMQQEDQNLFAGVYVNAKSVEYFKVKEIEEDRDKGQPYVRQVNIARDRCFDLIMDMIRNGQVLVVSSDEDDLWVRHLMDQKRVRQFRQDELVFVWEKTQGNDHYHHALLYCLVASRILGVASGYGFAVSPILGTFKVTQPKAETHTRI